MISYKSEKRKEENKAYSNLPRDLGNMKHNEFIFSLKEIFKGIFPLLKPKAHCIINIADPWENDKRIILHISVIHALEEIGYELRNIIIWNKRNLINRTGIFGYPNNFITIGSSFEYLLDFYKP